MTTTSWRLGGIEALRGLAAISVIFYHVSRHVNQAFATPDLVAVFQSGHSGVDLFFVISGFIILFVHGQDLGQPRRLSHYFSRRVTRVLPLYWIALSTTIATTLAAGRRLPDAGSILQSALLLPVGEPILGVAWTLQYEAVFYVMFALLILNRVGGLLLMAGWFVWVAIAASDTGETGGAILSGDYVLQFGMGMAAAALVRWKSLPAPRLLAAGGALTFATMMVLESFGRLDGYSTLARIAYGVPAAVLVLGLAGTERRKALGVPNWLRHLGGASYSLYLFQYVFISVAWQGWQVLRLGAVTPAWLCFLVLSAAAIGGGLLIAWGVEKPLLRQMRERRTRRPAPQAPMLASTVSATTSTTTTAAPNTSPVWPPI